MMRKNVYYINCLMLLGGLCGILAACSGVDDQALIQEVKGRPAATYAVFHTDHGNFVARLFTDQALVTTANFIGLAEGVKPFTNPRNGKIEKRRFYDGQIFFRTEPDYFILTGDLLGLGSTGPGYTLEPEVSSGLRHDRPGILSMVMTAENQVSGSQFMITLRPAAEFDWANNPFGEIVQGLEIVREFSLTPRFRGARPIRNMVIRKLCIFRVLEDGSVLTSPPPLDDAYLMGPQPSAPKRTQPQRAEKRIRAPPMVLAWQQSPCSLPAVNCL